jgi:hypothetical protein
MFNRPVNFIHQTPYNYFLFWTRIVLTLDTFKLLLLAGSSMAHLFRSIEQCTKCILTGM